MYIYISNLEKQMKNIKAKKIRVPLPKQVCKVQTTNKKVYNRKNYKLEY